MVYRIDIKIFTYEHLLFCEIPVLAEVFLVAAKTEASSQ